MTATLLPAANGSKEPSLFQQHKAFLGGAAGKRMMGCRIKLTRGSVQRSLGIKHQRQQL